MLCVCVNEVCVLRCCIVKVNSFPFCSRYNSITKSLNLEESLCSLVERRGGGVGSCSNVRSVSSVCPLSDGRDAVSNRSNFPS